LYTPKGIWRQIIERRAPQLTLLPSKLETDIESVPSRLEERAFIDRYVKPLIPLELEIGEQTQVAMLISRAYMDSYLEELDAMILIDTKIGGLDCGLPSIVDGRLRTFSFHQFHLFFKGINLNQVIERRLVWKDLITLRDNLVFNWLVNLLIQDSFDINRPLENAILKSRYLEKFGQGYFGKKPLEEVLNRLNRLFDAVEPILRSYSTEVGGLLEVTKPAEKQRVSGQRVPRRTKRPSESRPLIESEAALRREIYDFLISINLFYNENRRQAILDYSGLDLPLLAQIQFNGPTDVFLQSLTKILLDYGTLETGTDAMVAFLDAVKQRVGEDRKQSIDILVERWKSLRRIN